MNNKEQFFCEVVLENDSVIKFRMIESSTVDAAINILKEQYTNIKEWVVKDLTSGVWYTNKE